MKLAKMGFSCLIEISKLACTCQGNMVSLEPWGIIGVPLDIHLGHFLRISAKMGIYCLIEISKLVCPYMGNMMSLESWDIIGVPLDIHLGNFLRILAKMGFLVSSRSRSWYAHTRATRCRWYLVAS